MRLVRPVLVLLALFVLGTGLAGVMNEETLFGALSTESCNVANCISFLIAGRCSLFTFGEGGTVLSQRPFGLI